MMLLHPDVQQRAQEEIDRVLGSDRLPLLKDRESLPYLEAVMLECLRWHPIAPIGLNDGTFMTLFLTQLFTRRCSACAETR